MPIIFFQAPIRITRLSCECMNNFFSSNDVKAGDFVLFQYMYLAFVVDGYFLKWSSWGKCSKTCGSGVTSRERECQQPEHGGKSCSGLTLQQSVCTNPAMCPGKPHVHTSVFCIDLAPSSLGPY
jgi:hypothetical protein